MQMLDEGRIRSKAGYRIMHKVLIRRQRRQPPHS